jgi:predicted nuclease of predicted toxin-antitoxin system
MVEPVAAFLNGRGHRTLRARQVGLGADDDAILAEYARVNDLVVVTFDYDLRSSVIRRGCRCLHILPRETTARRRLASAYAEMTALFAQGCHLVTVDKEGRARAS